MIDKGSKKRTRNDNKKKSVKNNKYVPIDKDNEKTFTKKQLKNLMENQEKEEDKRKTQEMLNKIKKIEKQKQKEKKIDNITKITANVPVPILQTKTNDYPANIFDKSPSNIKINVNYGDNITSFNEDLKTKYINKLLELLESNKEKFLTKYKLNLPTLEEQYNTNKNKETEENLNNLEKNCRLGSDYIDMVHDFRICFEYLEAIITNETDIAYLKEIRKKICSSPGNNINVKNSHTEQIIILNHYIKELRKRNFIIPDLPSIEMIGYENVASIENIKSYYLESGRDINKFINTALKLDKNNKFNWSY